MTFHRAHSVHLKLEKVLSPFILLFIIIPAFQGSTLGSIINNYDLMAGNVNMLMLFNGSSPETLEMPVMVNQNMNVRIYSIVPDHQSNGIYFRGVTRSTTSIFIYYPETNQTTLIIADSRESIGGISLYENYIYWSNETNHSMMRLAVKNWIEDNSTSNPQLVFTDSNGTLKSSTVHPLTGVIYYTIWGSSSNGSHIKAFDPLTKEIRIIVDNLYNPSSLHIDGSDYLYWFDNPPGTYFNMERINLQNYTKRDFLLRERDDNQHPFSLTVACSSKVYWSDVLHNAIWELDIYKNKKQTIKYFKHNTPYALSLTNNQTRCQNLTKEENTAPTITTTVPLVEMITTKTSYKDSKKQSTTLPLKHDLIENPITSAAPSNSPTSTSTLKPNSEAKPSEGITITNSYNFCNFSERNHCQNGASCVNLDNEIYCICASGFGGPMCSEKTEINFHSSLSSWSSNPPFFLSCTVFTLVIVILLIIILFLTIRLRKLDTKPRIRRRVVVAHRSDYDNPTGGSSSVCEMIDIENCCNMNVCETPCYERLGAGSSNGGNVSIGRNRKNSVKEDKKCLLNS